MTDEQAFLSDHHDPDGHRVVRTSTPATVALQCSCGASLFYTPEAAVGRLHPEPPMTHNDDDLSSKAIEAMNAGDWKRACTLWVLKVDKLYRLRAAGEIAQPAPPCLFMRPKNVRPCAVTYPNDVLRWCAPCLKANFEQPPLPPAPPQAPKP